MLSEVLKTGAAAIPAFHNWPSDSWRLGEAVMMSFFILLYIIKEDWNFDGFPFVQSPNTLLSISRLQHFPYPPWTQTSDRSWSVYPCRWRLIIFKHLTSARIAVSQVCLTFILAIGASGESSKGRCDRLIHGEQPSWLSDPLRARQFQVFGNVGR